jgi:hypothetical protein
MIITLCGSTRFARAYSEWSARFTLKGWSVFSIGVSLRDPLWACTPPAELDEIKAHLDIVHRNKIEASDEIFVLDLPVDGAPYIGTSTRAEIVHAEMFGKTVRYISKEYPGWTEEDCLFVPPPGCPLPLLAIPKGMPIDELAFLADVASERASQLYRHGYDSTHDDGHGRGELSLAAAAYLLGNSDHGVDVYPWPHPEGGGAIADKLGRKQALDRVRIAMALALAEAGRLIRQRGRGTS